MKVTYHLILVLHQELDTLDGGGGGLGHGLKRIGGGSARPSRMRKTYTHGRDTAHHEIDWEDTTGQLVFEPNPAAPARRGMGPVRGLGGV